MIPLYFNFLFYTIDWPRIIRKRTLLNPLISNLMIVEFFEKYADNQQ